MLSATVRHAVDNENNAQSDVNKSSDGQQQSSAGGQVNYSAPAPQDADIIACVSDVMIETPVHTCDVFDNVYKSNHYACLSGIDRIDCGSDSVDSCMKSEELKASDLAPLRYVSVQVGDGIRYGKNVNALYDTGAEIPLAHSSVIDGLNVRKCGSVNIRSAVGESVKCDLCRIVIRSADVTDEHHRELSIMCAVTEKANGPLILTADVIDNLMSLQCKVVLLVQTDDDLTNVCDDDNHDDVNVTDEKLELESCDDTGEVVSGVSDTLDNCCYTQFHC